MKNPAHSVNHHEVYVTEKHVEVELHTLLAEPFDDKETNRLMEELQKEVAVQAGKKEIDGDRIPGAAGWHSCVLSSSSYASAFSEGRVRSETALRLGCILETRRDGKRAGTV